MSALAAGLLGFVGGYAKSKADTIDRQEDQWREDNLKRMKADADAKEYQKRRSDKNNDAKELASHKQSVKDKSASNKPAKVKAPKIIQIEDENAVKSPYMLTESNTLAKVKIEGRDESNQMQEDLVKAEMIADEQINAQASYLSSDDTDFHAYKGSRALAKEDYTQKALARIKAMRDGNSAGKNYPQLSQLHLDALAKNPKMANAFKAKFGFIPNQ